MARPKGGRRGSRANLRNITDRQRSLLDLIESAIRRIAFPQDEAGFFHSQVQHALLLAGLSCDREVMMTNNRRVDIVVVETRGTVAIELEREAYPERTVEKFRELPQHVMRMLVLRHRPVPLEKAHYCDRVVCLTSDIRAVEWTVTGHAINSETPPALYPAVHQALMMSHDRAMVRRDLMMAGLSTRGRRKFIRENKLNVVAGSSRPSGDGEAA